MGIGDMLLELMFTPTRVRVRVRVRINRVLARVDVYYFTPSDVLFGSGLG